MTALKVGIIGCGRVARTLHLPALRSLPAAEVVALADRDAQRLQAVAEQFHIAGRHSDYRALLADPEVELVGVCVPAQFHAPIAIDALDAGKHVFVEKPLALSLDDSARLLDKAAHSAGKVMVGFNLRWHPLVRQARAMLRQGQLGTLTLMRSALTSTHDSVPAWRHRRALGGGALVEMAVHHFDLWRYLLGSEVEQLFATSQSGEWEDETATVSARMTNGVLAACVVSERTSQQNEFELYGAAGRLRVACYQSDGLEFVPLARVPGDPRLRLQKLFQMLIGLPQAALQLREGGGFLSSYRAEWRHFVDAIQRDTPVECSAADGHHAVQIMLAALESAEKGQAVTVQGRSKVG